MSKLRINKREPVLKTIDSVILQSSILKFYHETGKYSKIGIIFFIPSKVSKLYAIPDNNFHLNQNYMLTLLTGLAFDISYPNNYQRKNDPVFSEDKIKKLQNKNFLQLVTKTRIDNIKFSNVKFELINNTEIENEITHKVKQNFKNSILKRY